MPQDVFESGGVHPAFVAFIEDLGYPGRMTAGQEFGQNRLLMPFDINLHDDGYASITFQGIKAVARRGLDFDQINVVGRAGI